jgi:hypothetical protein
MSAPLVVAVLRLRSMRGRSVDMGIGEAALELGQSADFSTRTAAACTLLDVQVLAKRNASGALIAAASYALNVSIVALDGSRHEVSLKREVTLAVGDEIHVRMTRTPIGGALQ